MAAVNGHVDEQETPATPLAQLGKRKRGSSPNSLRHSVAKTSASTVKESIENVVRELRSHDFGPLLLRQTSQQHPASPPTKRRRTVDRKQAIESAIATSAYTTIDEFLEDISHATTILAQKSSDEEINSDSIAATVDKIVLRVTHKSNGNVHEEKEQESPNASKAIEILSLRGSLEGGGVKQLFTGLRKIPPNDVKVEEIDAKSLPNGFEVVEATTLASISKSSKDARTFGDVFGSRRNVKQLEMPRSTRGSRNNVLNFVEPFDEMQPANKQDYKYATLNSGNWVTYAGSPMKPSRTPSSSKESDIEKRSQALFRASFSSFAPTQDNMYSVVSQTDRAKLWWRKYGSEKWSYPTIPDELNAELSGNLLPEISDDMAEVITSFEPEQPDVKANDDNKEATEDESEKLLSEVSELLQTLSSYQYIRDSESNRTSSSAVKPTPGELDIYELLKSQLKLLVEALPPFAVAKLDGDQLKALNISTNITINTLDYPGTGQADEYSLRRHRAAQTQPNTYGRTPSVPQGPPRPYGSNAGYNSQARGYNNSMTGTPHAGGYVQRPATATYSTPRPGMMGSSAPYSQTPYNRTPGQHPATIQEYQRSLQQNGYNPNLAAQQTTYNQRTPQASFPVQQAQYRSASPQKPLTNGQTPSGPPRQYNPPSYVQGGRPATIQQHQAMQQMKAYQEAQRQASGTPQPATELNGRVNTPSSDVQSQ